MNRVIEQIFFSENMKTVKRHMKKFSTLLTISEIQVLTIRYCLTPVRMVIIPKITNNKHCQQCGEKGTRVHCWWKCRLVHPLWKIVRMLPKANIELPYDPTIQRKTLIQNIYNPTFTTALFTVVKKWIQPKCTSTTDWINRWINKMCIPYTRVAFL